MASLRGTGRLYERPTLDVVVLILAVVVAVVIVGGVATIAVLEMMDTATATDEAVALLDSHVGTIIGALLGLVAGQATGRREAEERFTTPT